MNTKKLLSALEKKLETSSQQELANALGVSVQTLLNWKNGGNGITEIQIANAISKCRHAAVKHAHYHAIKPIVEFYPIDVDDSSQKVKYELFKTRKDASEFNIGLRKALSGARGIYIFYDSRGRALYAGKAKEQSLWAEMKSVFNRDRKTQKVYRVAHPERKQEFLPAYEFNRQPKETQLQLCDYAAYFSAYKVDDGMIDDLEALLVRGFANDLLNIKMERFVHAKEDI